jgi:type IV secretory pathway VirJ component
VTAQTYAQTARKHWTTFRPEATAQLADPETFFKDLGARVETLVQRRAEQLAAAEKPQPTTEQERRDLMLWAFRTAEAEVLEQEVFLPAEPDARENELPVDEPTTPPAETPTP